MARIASKDRLKAALTNRQKEDRYNAVVADAVSPRGKKQKRLMVELLPAALAANGFGPKLDDPEIRAIVAETCGQPVPTEALGHVEGVHARPAVDDGGFEHAETTRSGGSPVELVDQGTGLPGSASE